MTTPLFDIVDGRIGNPNADLMWFGSPCEDSYTLAGDTLRICCTRGMTSGDDDEFEVGVYTNDGYGDGTFRAALLVTRDLDRFLSEVEYLAVRLDSNDPDRVLSDLVAHRDGYERIDGC